MFRKINDVVIIATLVYAAKGLVDLGIDLVFEAKQVLTK